MLKRIKNTVIGDVFCAKIDENHKKYLQYIVSDLTQLNSDVIRAFKKSYPIDANPDLSEIVTGEVDFYAQWIQNKIDNNYHILDLGPKGNSISSPYYNLEVGRTLSYPYLHPTNTYNMQGIRIIRFKY